MDVRTRFAPSPTGFLHLGNIWIALWNWLWTRQHDGKIILRIEDIDRQRSKENFAKALQEDLAWLGLDWDEGPGGNFSYGSCVQSERLERYEIVLGEWKQSGRVYPCYCNRARLLQIASAPHEGEARPVYDGHCRRLSEEEREKETKIPSWRYRMETQTVSYDDLFLGHRERELRAGEDDFVVCRADGMMAYQLAAAADDGAMGITHVFRGRDLADSAFGQIVLLQELGYAPPTYAHLPLLVDTEGVRLSKRQRGITVRELRETGRTAAEILGQLFYLAGAIQKTMPVSAEEALRNISFEDCPRLRDEKIVCDI